MNTQTNYKAAQTRYDDADILYRKCGKSGIKLPKISLGLWHNFGAADPYQRSREMVHYAFDHGITHFDLANNYGPPYGSGEETFGKILQDGLQNYRHELFISTKAGYDMWPGPYGNWGSRKHLLTSLEQSLKRMKTDYVDLFYSHRYDPETPLEETLQALVDAVRQGKALYVGISRWPLEALKTAYSYLKAHDTPLLIYQGRLNLLDRKPQNEGIIEYCRLNGIGFIAFSPLAQGLLSDRYLNGIPTDSRMAKGRSLSPEKLTPALKEYLKQLNNLALSRDQAMAEMALSWVLQQRGVTSALVGTSTTEQLKTNLQCLHAEPIIEKEMPKFNAK